jgi:hypothetical protein
MMSFRPRAVILAGFLAIASLVAPSAASAWGGGGGAFGRHGSQRELIQRVCSEAGAPLSTMPSGNWHARWRWHGLEEGHGLSGLTEAQTKELKAACETLKKAVEARRMEDEAAFKTFDEKLATARETLDKACPALTEHRAPGTELSTACKEAIKTFVTEAGKEREALDAALKQASKTFQTALEKFEKATKAIFEKLEAERIEREGMEREYEREHFAHGFPTPGFHGQGFPGGGPQGGNGPATGPPGGNSQGGNSQGGNCQGGNSQGGNSQGGGFQGASSQGGGFQGGRGGGRGGI